MKPGPKASLLVGKPIEDAAMLADFDTEGKDSTPVQSSQPGQITIHSDVTEFHTDSFTCKPMAPLSDGDILAMMGAYSYERVAYHEGSKNIPTLPGGAFGEALRRLPVFAVVTTLNGRRQSVLPGILTMKIALGAGQVVHSGGYQIEALTPLKSGETVDVLVVGNALLSAQHAYGEKVTDAGHATPFFAAFKDDMDRVDCASAIEAWRITMAHALGEDYPKADRLDSSQPDFVRNPTKKPLERSNERHLFRP